MENTNIPLDFFPEKTPLTELMRMIKKENSSYTDENIQNAVSEAVKKYQPNYEGKLDDIKADALASLNWNASL